VLDDKDVDGILGKDIRSNTGEDMGRIVDVLVNRSGQVRAAIIDFGGFLGVGSRKVAVDWRAIQFAPDGKLDKIIVSLSRNEVRLAPEFKHGEPVVVLGGPSSNAAPPPATPQPSANAAPPPANGQPPAPPPAPPAASPPPAPVAATTPPPAANAPASAANPPPPVSPPASPTDAATPAAPPPANK
jgi:sporulation protein YlmC with PRC-barrel domain